MKFLKFVWCLGLLGFMARPAHAQMTTSMNPTTVGGQMMYPAKDIVSNAVNSKDHTTLVAAVKAAGLVETLQGAGPFTVFAPVNAAFSALPAGTVDKFIKAGKQTHAHQDPHLSCGGRQLRL